MWNLRFWFANRVILGLAAFFVLVGMWEYRWKPQYRPHYEQGIADYKAGRYQDAVGQFNRAYAIAPNSADVLIMAGWSNLKLNRFEEARFYFDRALRIDGRLEEARLGSAFIALETGKGVLDYDLLQKHLGRRSGDPNVQILAAGALVKEGKNFAAAELYQGLLNDPSYGEASRIALDEMFGLRGFPSETLPRILPAAQRPNELQVNFRAADGKIWRRENNQWQPMYVAGVNLGPGSPGHFPALPPQDGALYLSWIREAEAMNANVLRLYTLLPPAFYRAYRHHIASGGKILLYQQIWVGDPPDKDLYDSRFYEDTKAEIRYVVDAMHGRGDVPKKHARGSGIYDRNIAAHVAALLLGRELEASVVLQTNLINAGKQSYQGKFVTVKRGTPTEIWFAEMLDYLIAYQQDTYNWQHPVAIVNWPPLDPLYHPTEAPNIEEVKFRIRRGEQLQMPKELEDDNDTASIDEARFSVESPFTAGLFASYHVYPYYPDFLLFDGQYQKARDSLGPNPVFGYIKELKARIPHPLLITEYGMPNSVGISHFHPRGWHHGGHNEQEQAAIVAQLSQSIQEAGCAGGIVFALVDEWYKHNWLRVHFQDPGERAPLWIDELDPEKRYGAIGFRLGKAKLFSSDPAAWAGERTLYNASGRGQVLQVQAAADEGYFYLRLTGACLGCSAGPVKSGEKSAYAIAINTHPRQFGVQTLPYGDLRLDSGANFMLELGPQEDSARLLIASNYNPYRITPKPGVPGETELSYRRNYMAKLEPAGGFEEMIVETNRRRFARDGTMFAGQRYSRSILRHATDPKDRAPESLAEWFYDAKAKTIVVRLAWGKLGVTDPSSRRVFSGFTDAVQLRSVPTPAFEVSVLELRSRANSLYGAQVAGTLPAAAGNKLAAPATFSWDTWEKVKAEPYRKQMFTALQKVFREQTHAPTGAAPLRAGVSPRATRPVR